MILIIFGFKVIDHENNYAAEAGFTIFSDIIVNNISHNYIIITAHGFIWSIISFSVFVCVVSPTHFSFFFSLLTNNVRRLPHKVQSANISKDND